MSPGFTPRPWLSEAQSLASRNGKASVAGVYAPALVERQPMRWLAGKRGSRVAGVYAPALVERFQLAGRRIAAATVSPGFTPRPWLSDDQRQRLLAEDQEWCRRGLRPGLG